MAVFGKYESLKKDIADMLFNDDAREYLELAVDETSSVNQRVMSLEQGQSNKIDLRRGVFIIEQCYLTKKCSELFFESHQKYIDLQLILSGQEAVHVSHLSNLNISEDYNKEHDYFMYSNIDECSRILLQSNETCLLYPNDGHMPSISINNKPDVVHKIVMKIPLVC